MRISRKFRSIVILTLAGLFLAGCTVPDVIRPDQTPSSIPEQTEATADDGAPGQSAPETETTSATPSGDSSAEAEIVLSGTETVDSENQFDDPAASLEAITPKDVPPPVPAKKSDESLLDEALDFCQAAQEFWQEGELESALEALDQAYSLLLQVENDEDVTLNQQREDIRFLISKRILEIYASRNIVVNGNHKAIPLDMNQHVQAEIKRFTTVERQFFIESYQRSGRFREDIITAIREAGLPEELAWLPLIESGFKVKALSRARALGLWQFIPSTGYKFGLKRDTYIDERLDPIKSTNAAIAYLKELHQMFGDWTTALAGYNCGEYRVLRVIRSQNVNYLDNFWDLYQRLPRETARYVPRFLATLHILKDPEKYGMTDLIADPPWEFETVTIKRQVHLKHVATAIDVPPKALRDLNPELRYQIVPNMSYGLRVPPGKAVELLARVDRLPVSSPPRPAYVYHRIRRGETLSTIARKYRTSVSRIARANNIRRSHYIVAGKTLKIPLRGTMVSTVELPAQKCPPGSEEESIHRVRSGDSLWIIAKRYGTTTARIQQMNSLDTTVLNIGQRLKVPGCKKTKPDTKGMRTYVVRSGDSPFIIAKQHNMPLNRFLQTNGLTPRSTIYPGQALYVD